jgi:hypothetical protein
MRAELVEAAPFDKLRAHADGFRGMWMTRSGRIVITLSGRSASLAFGRRG